MRSDRYRIDVEKAENHPVDATVGHAIGPDAHQSRVQLLIRLNLHLALDASSTAQHGI